MLNTKYVTVLFCKAESGFLSGPRFFKSNYSLKILDQNFFSYLFEASPSSSPTESFSNLKFLREGIVTACLDEFSPKNPEPIQNSTIIRRYSVKAFVFISNFYFNTLSAYTRAVKE
jgi:hypothetical protein